MSMAPFDPDDLPWSCEAEQSVLGGLLCDNAAWDRVANRLLRASFYDVRHGRIFEVIGSMVNACKPADVVTVFEQLQRDGDVEECGGLAYLNALAQSVPSAANIGRYAEIVAERAAHRALMETADEALQIARGAGDLADKTDRIMAGFQALQLRGMRAAPVPIDTTLATAVDRYNALAAGERVPGIPTGLAELDKVLNGGLRPGKVIILAARPGIGKSSLAEQIVLRVAALGQTCLYLSQEMEADELTDRAVANVGAIGFSRLLNGQLTDKEWGRLGDAVDKLARLPLHFDDQAGLTLQQIRAKAMSLRQQGLKVLVLDYLQLCSGSRNSRRENRNAEIEEISRGVKKLAKDLGLTAIVLSQLSREVEKRSPPKPILSDLRDSGSIEQDADVVLMLWTKRIYSTHRLVGVTVPKNRQGVFNVDLDLEFRGYFQRWSEPKPDESDFSEQQPGQADVFVN